MRVVNVGWVVGGGVLMEWDFGLLLVLGVEVVKGKDEVVTILKSRRKKRAYCRAAQGLDT